MSTCRPRLLRCRWIKIVLLLHGIVGTCNNMYEIVFAWEVGERPRDLYFGLRFSFSVVQVVSGIVFTGKPRTLGPVDFWRALNTTTSHPVHAMVTQFENTRANKNARVRLKTFPWTEEEILQYYTTLEDQLYIIFVRRLIIIIILYVQ